MGSPEKNKERKEVIVGGWLIHYYFSSFTQLQDRSVCPGETLWLKRVTSKTHEIREKKGIGSGVSLYKDFIFVLGKGGYEVTEVTEGTESPSLSF